jgi:hypothetical protein
VQQPKLYVIHLLLLSVGALMIVGLIVFIQVITSTTTSATATATSEMKDMELEDKAIKEEVEPIETEEIREEDEDNTAKQEEEGKEKQEEQQSDDDTSGTGLEEDIMIDDNYSSYEDVPLELPFDNPMPFP